jgi:hypothetical protein
MFYMSDKQSKLSDARKAIYLRNKTIVESFKHGKKCENCKTTFNHYQLEFAEDPSSPNSVAKLVINRASPDRLASAMFGSTLLCLNCLAKWRTIHPS